MQKINDKLPIETWKEIAYHVQRLKFSDGREEEFKNNLKMLKELLTTLNLEIIEGSRIPKVEKEIGLSSFLQSIYDSQMLTFCKSGFYEKIYTLAELGVSEIKYCPICFPSNIQGKKVYYDKQNKTIIQKFYTDGSFVFQSEAQVRKNDSGTTYKIRDLSNASFLLKVSLEKKDINNNERIKLKSASAYLKGFREDFPSKKEFLSAEFPELQINEQTIAWGENPIMKENFDFFDIKELKKRLVLDYANGWFYTDNENN